MQTKTAKTTNITPAQNSLLRSWLEPKSLHRDEQFRERSIRIAILLVMSIGLLSLFLSIFVLQNEWSLISFPTFQVVVVVSFLLSAIAITQGKVYIAAWLILIPIIIAIIGILYLSAEQSQTYHVLMGIPELLITLIIAALVLPRKYLIPLSIVSSLLYSALLLLFQSLSFNLPELDTSNAIITATVLFIGSALILSRLRREFDERLDAVEEARQRAEAADNSKSQFLANMSHELRTPLNATIGYSEAMLGGMAGEFSDPQRELLSHIQYNSRRLLSLINDILDLSKVESGSLEVFLSPMSPGKLIIQTVESLRSLAQEKDIQLEVKLDPSVPEVVLADSKKLEQILTNLVSNAIKFTEKGKVVVFVSDEGELDSTFWKFSVRDTGVGIPADATEYIFEPFRQVDNSATRKYKGTGLGLSITKKLVDHLDGTITIESKEGEGTCFTVLLPKASIPTVGNT